MISILLNGESHQFEQALTIQELMAHLKLQPTLYLVEVNQTALFRSEWETKKIETGDQIEIIRVVAGG
ncbi:MAG: sulfur carrier protein ThiS [Verrucomicrobiota bacterium]